MIKINKTKKTTKNKKINILTLDLETRPLPNRAFHSRELEVISSCVYDGKDYLTFYITDYQSSKELLEATINCLLDPKYNKYKLYIHNFSFFDSTSLFEHIINLKEHGYEVNFLIKERENKFFYITITKYSYTSYINKNGLSSIEKNIPRVRIL